MENIKTAPLSLCIDSPLGVIEITQKGNALSSLVFRAGATPPQCGKREELSDILQQASEQLKEYFTHKRKVFKLPLSPHGTDFQKRVWKALQDIPYGETISYKGVAEKLKLSPEYARAIGMASSANPLAILIPCHRVISSDGRLNGYAYGIKRKQALLNHEGSYRS